MVAALAVDLEVHEIQSADTESLLQTMESAKVAVSVQMGVTATEHLSASDTEEFREKFMTIAAAIKTPKIRSDVLLAERMSSKILDRSSLSDKEKGSGLDLIFYKLDELETEIQNECKGELADMNAKRKQAQDEIDTETATIDNAMKIRQENTDANKNSHQDILECRRIWYESRNMESGPGGIHETLVTLQADREEASEIIRGEVDDRNKAIDVLVKALFLVCERFNRFKNTELCMMVKSQPDIIENDRYETKEPDEAEQETGLTHKADTPFAIAWEQQKEKDIQLEGAICPENPEICPVLEAMRGDIAIEEGKKFEESDTLTFYEEQDQNTSDHCAEACNMSENCKAFLYVKDTGKCKLTEGTPAATTDDTGYVTGIKPEADDGDDESNFSTQLLQLGAGSSTLALTADEQRAQKSLKELTSIRLPARYSVPLEELAIATGASVSAKKKKNIVQIIIQVTDETRVEQKVAKQNHQDKLDAWYAESWVKKGALDQERAQQNTQWAKWQEERSNIEQRIIASEAQRQTQNAALEARVMIEDRITEDERVYGIEESLRLEDLENLVKLKSLLRALYDVTKPMGCPRTAGVLCTDKVAGWCVFAKRTPDKSQRCSCNVGFYGDACQFRMCPGMGDVLYEHDAEGVCSNRGLGEVGGLGCDNTIGRCTCDPNYYHGPAKKCEYRHAPASKYETTGDDYLMKAGTIDDRCSDRGTLDKIRGICTCSEAYWGVAPNAQQINGACETRKCPNSNGVVYPYNSANACNGHGACIPESGACSCQEPYFGHSCENTNCPNDCSGKGECNTNTGQCACHQSPIKYSGPSCEFLDCPAGCNDPSGECNRNDGKCVCKLGYTGEKCELSSRCTARALDTPEANWWTLWDKPGWIACPKGQLMYALKRGTCDALSCIDSGSCAAGCQGDSFVYQLRHCYHDLGWYNSMDQEGWSKCLPDYYVAGLYRSCESLYCLNMAKCCSLKGARWAQCGTTVWGSSFSNAGWSRLGEAGAHAFITGFQRSKAHTIGAIDSASYCGFVRGY
jgi:hypothetical protein